MNQPIRILVIDRHPVVRKGYKFIFEAFDNVHLAGTLSSIKEAIESSIVDIDVALISFYALDMSQVNQLQTFIHQIPNCKIIGMIGNQFQSEIIRAYQSQLHAIIHRNAKIVEIIQIVHQVFGGIHHKTSFAGTDNNLENMIDVKAIKLTKRESEVLSHLCSGDTNRKIADELSLSPSTIRSHIRRIFTKLGVKNRTEAASIAIRHQLISQNPTQKN